MEPAILCEDLHKSFGGVTALDGVDLALPATGVIGVIGPNGAGKSTLFNAITGWVQPDGGCCRVGGRAIGGLRPHQVARLGVARTFQALRLVDSVSALENVQLCLPRQRGEGLLRAIVGWGWAEQERGVRAAAERQLAQVGLDRLAGAAASQLSYGQRKLLSLACCEATGASILLLDEPVAGVDPRMREQIIGRIRGNRERHLTVIIEHDIEAVEAIADELVVMDAGAVIARGPTEEVLRRQEIIEAYVN